MAERVTHERVSLEGAKSHLRAVLSRTVASALICGIDNAACEGRPLTQLQQIDVATMAVMAYQEGLAAAESTLEVEATLVRVMDERRRDIENRRDARRG